MREFFGSVIFLFFNETMPQLPNFAFPFTGSKRVLNLKV